MDRARILELARLAAELRRDLKRIDVKSALPWLDRAKSLRDACFDRGHVLQDLKGAVQLDVLGGLVAALEHFAKVVATGFNEQKRTVFDELLATIGQAFEASSGAGTGSWWLVDPEDERDHLTSLAAKKALDRDLAQGTAAATQDSRLSVVMFDIDFFKRVNDTHGHETGNEVLRRVAAVLREVALSRGKAYRYGGEEMTLLLPNCSEPEAIAAADRVRSRVEHLRFEKAGLGVTISGGVSSVPSPGIETATDAVEAADKALYRAKEGGRNRVCCTEVGEEEAKSESAETTPAPCEHATGTLEWRRLQRLFGILELAGRSVATLAEVRAEERLTQAWIAAAVDAGLLRHGPGDCVSVTQYAVQVFDLVGWHHWIQRRGMPPAGTTEIPVMDDDEQRASPSEAEAIRESPVTEEGALGREPNAGDPESDPGDAHPFVREGIGMIRELAGVLANEAQRHRDDPKWWNQLADRYKDRGLQLENRGRLEVLDESDRVALREVCALIGSLAILLVPDEERPSLGTVVLGGVVALLGSSAAGAAESAQQAVRDARISNLAHGILGLIQRYKAKPWSR